MDIYQATLSAIEAAAPGINTTFFQIEFNEITESWELPDLPAVTYLYSNLQQIATHTGGSGLYKAVLDIDIWGDLEQVSATASAIRSGIANQRKTVQNVTFTMVEKEGHDVAELTLPVKHYLLRLSGMIEVRPEPQQNTQQ